MSSRISSSSSSSVESESTFLRTIKRIHTEYERYENSTEKLQILRDKLYQTWMKTAIVSDLTSPNREGYHAVEYLEQLLSNNTITDSFLILILNTLSKNENFYHELLNDHQRFKSLFNSTSGKPVFLMRYIELLYYYCPEKMLSTTGLEFYRFIVDSYCLKYLHQVPCNVDWLGKFSTLISQFYENTTKYLLPQEFIFKNENDAIVYSIYAIDTLLHHHVKAKIAKDFIYEVKLINTITKAVGVVWEQTPSSGNSTQENLDRITPVQLRSLEHLFNIMSNNKSPRPHFSSCEDHSKTTTTTTTTFSPAIFPLFPYIQLDAVDLTLKTMLSDGRLNGERLSNMVLYLIELIDAPIQLNEHMAYETWTIGLCMTLVSCHQHDYVNKIIDQTTIFLIEHLFCKQTADNAFQILFWFVRYDKRIETFRLILDRLPKLFEQLTTTNNEDLKTKMIELCHMGVAIHPDYNISNEMILKQMIYTLPQPDLNILLNHKNTHAKLHSIALENEKKIKNRVGIINLGNTCYVNSVLQALYQCDLFRKYILEQRFDEQIVLRELQIIFAQLNLSKRPYIDAINLVKIARPAWFTINEQQDCAEFLGYLLDTIKDEEKKDKHISSHEIHRLFTIRTCQINRCQRCSTESHREESSNYLFLPIPTSNQQQQYENLNYNQSATPISVMKNGLKFYAASNRNSLGTDQVKSSTTSLVPPKSINQPSIPHLSSNSSNHSPSPPSYDSTLNSFSLQFVFDCYFEKEELKDDNQYRCEHYRLQNAERYTILQTAPQYLILSLNRFEYDKQTHVFRKVFTKMTYPKVLHVHVNPSRINHPLLTHYCLVLIIVHTGYTLHGGHYYVYAREIKPLSTTKNNRDEHDEWFLLNDDLVTLSSYEAMIENCAQYTSATPYVLVYKRIDEERIEAMEGIKQIRVHESLIEQIREDNRNYERELEK